MNEEILKLWEEVTNKGYTTVDQVYEAFYRAAEQRGFNAGLEASLEIKPQDIAGGISAADSPHEVWKKHIDAIRALKEKP